MQSFEETLVPGTGLEPAHLSAPDPKSGVSTNSTTRARVLLSKSIVLTTNYFASEINFL